MGDSSFAPTGLASHQGITVLHGCQSKVDPMGGNLIHWRSNRQTLITKSTCEAELLAAVEALEMADNLSVTLSEATRSSCDMEISSDNSAAVTMLGAETSAFRTRHISVKGAWAASMIKMGVKLSYLQTDLMVADSLTKGMLGAQMPKVHQQLRLVDQ